MHYNKGPDMGDNMANMEETLKYWNFEGAIDAVKQLAHAYGNPRSMSICDAEWEHVAGFNRVWVQDESIPHESPAPHQDWLYSERSIVVPSDLYEDLANVTGSILIDAQRGVVIARCQKLVKNAVTLGFVEDVVAGTVKATPEEYAKRIEGNIVPEWFNDKLGELSEAVVGRSRKGIQAKGGRSDAHVFASWEDGVLTWAAKGSKLRNARGSDPMKKKPTEKEVKKHLSKIFGKEFDLEFRHGPEGYKESIKDK